MTDFTLKYSANVITFLVSFLPLDIYVRNEWYVISKIKEKNIPEK